MADKVQLRVIFVTDIGEHTEQVDKALDAAIDIVANSARQFGRRKTVGQRAIIEITVNLVIARPIEADEQTVITLLLEVSPISAQLVASVLKIISKAVNVDRDLRATIGRSYLEVLFKRSGECRGITWVA